MCGWTSAREMECRVAGADSWSGERMEVSVQEMSHDDGEPRAISEAGPLLEPARVKRPAVANAAIDRPTSEPAA